MSAAVNDCVSAIQVYTDQPLRFAGLSQVIVSVCALLMFIYVYVYKLKEPLTPIHQNLKVSFLRTGF